MTLQQTSTGDFDGTGTQTITQNSGGQVIYLSATSTEVGEANAPVVVLTGSGTRRLQKFREPECKYQCNT